MKKGLRMVGAGMMAALLLTACVGCFKSREETSGGTASEGTTSATPETTTTVSANVTTGTTAAVGFVDFPAVGYATDSLNVRRDASTNYTAIGGLAFGEEITVLGKEGDWYKFTFIWTDENGKRQDTAYVSAQYVSAVKPKETAATTTTTAGTTAGTTVAG